MFEEIRLLGHKEDCIALQTRRGKSDIPNCIGLEKLPDSEIRKFDRVLKRFRQFYEVRKPPTGVYNCVGHVWASRRTGVYDKLDHWVPRIREEDGYRILDPAKEMPMTGDVVTYWESLNPYQNFLHIGIVEMREGLTKDSTRLPFVWSKLDGTLGEVLHHLRDVTFESDYPGFQTEFWTDRP